jgi:hypothetical protein
MQGCFLEYVKIFCTPDFTILRIHIPTDLEPGCTSKYIQYKIQCFLLRYCFKWITQYITFLEIEYLHSILEAVLGVRENEPGGEETKE